MRARQRMPDSRFQLCSASTWQERWKRQGPASPHSRSAMRYTAWLEASEDCRARWRSLAPLSFRGATYSGVFTLHPLISGENRAHHGEILARAAALVEAGKLTPLLNERRFSTEDIEAAYVLVEAGALGKVVINL